MLRTPQTTVRVAAARTLRVDFPNSLEERTIMEASAVLEELGRLVGEIPLKLDILDHIPEHVGLGSKTALLLGLLTAVREALALELSDSQLRILSGRGGTSGIGVHGFFTGGCIVDCGRRRTEGDADFVPSSNAPRDGVSQLIARYEIPQSWHVHIITPRGTVKSQAEEIEFFRQQTPISEIEVLRVLGLVYHGLLPALLEGNTSSLAASLQQIHQTGFKRRELETQAPEVQKMYGELVDSQIGAVGMSSLGPTLYVIAEANQDLVRSTVKALATRLPGTRYMETAGSNEGVSVQ